MSDTKTEAKYYAFKGSHAVATIHWAACASCRFGRGQDQSGKTYVDNQLQRGWTELRVSEDQLMLMVKRGTHRWCGACCRDLRDGKAAW